MKILVVEDEEAICEAMKELLNMFGHTCIVADTVDEAVAKICDERPDVILLDLILKNGLSTGFIYKTKELLANRIPRIIIISASNQAKKVAEQEQVEFLAKPFGIDDLWHILENDPQAERHKIPSEYWEGRCSENSSKEQPSA